MEGIIVTTNLLGNLEGVIRHTETQKNVIYLSKGVVEKNILHSDRNPTPCVRLTRISSEVASEWVSNEAPGWINPKKWKTMGKLQRIASYVNTFDEGFGVSFELVK